MIAIIRYDCDKKPYNYPLNDLWYDGIYLQQPINMDHPFKRSKKIDGKERQKEILDFT